MVQTFPELTKFLHTPPNSYHPWIHPNGKPFFTYDPRKNLEIFFLFVKSILPPVDCDADDWSSWSSCSDLYVHQAQVAMLKLLFFRTSDAGFGSPH